MGSPYYFSLSLRSRKLFNSEPGRLHRPSYITLAAIGYKDSALFEHFKHLIKDFFLSLRSRKLFNSEPGRLHRPSYITLAAIGYKDSALFEHFKHLIKDFFCP